MTAPTWKTLQAEATRHLAAGEIGRAANSLVEAIELAPQEPRLYEMLVRVALLGGGTETAVSAAAELRRVSPRDANAAYLHAVATLAHGDVDGAQVLLGQALELAPASWEARQALAQTWRMKQDDGRALAVLEEAVRLTPTAPGPVTDYAVLLLDLGRASDARAALEASAAVHPEDAGVQLQLALTCVKLGDATPARVHAERARQTTDPSLQELARELLAQLG